MNAQELYVVTDDPKFSTGFKPCEVWYCNKCRHVFSDQQYADSCCLPHEERYPNKPCEDCGTLAKNRHHSKCENCSIESRIQSGNLKVVSEKEVEFPLNYEDDYFDEIYCFVEKFIDDHYADEGLITLPKYLWVTEEQRVRADASDLLYSWLDNAFENAEDTVSDEAVKELQSFLDKWTEENCPVWYYPDYKRVVRIPWEDYTEELKGIQVA